MVTKRLPGGATPVTTDGGAFAAAAPAAVCSDDDTSVVSDAADPALEDDLASSRFKMDRRRLRLATEKDAAFFMGLGLGVPRPPGALLALPAAGDAGTRRLGVALPLPCLVDVAWRLKHHAHFLASLTVNSEMGRGMVEQLPWQYR